MIKGFGPFGINMRQIKLKDLTKEQLELVRSFITAKSRGGAEIDLNIFFKSDRGKLMLNRARKVI